MTHLLRPGRVGAATALDPGGPPDPMLRDGTHYDPTMTLPRERPNPEAELANAIASGAATPAQPASLAA